MLTTMTRTMHPRAMGRHTGGLVAAIEGDLIEAQRPHEGVEDNENGRRHYLERGENCRGCETCDGGDYWLGETHHADLDDPDGGAALCNAAF